MQLIVTHENTDFDAVAAQWAAQRVFGGRPLLSRRLNRNVERFLAAYGEAFDFYPIDSWTRRRVEGIILVDTPSLPSIRGVRPTTPVRLVDHHPPQSHPDTWQIQVERVGATTTLLVEHLQEAAFTPSILEATLFLLGIYEDTGRLSYDNATPRDAAAVAWLLAHEPDLEIVRTYLAHPLSPAQQALYAQLVASATNHTIESRSILVSAVTAPDEYDDEISTVVNQLRDDFNPDALFVLVALPRRVHLVARSAGPAVDVVKVAQALGGGGHSRAAAATMRDTPLAAALETVLTALPAAVAPVIRVRDIMSHHVKTVNAEDTVGHAAREMRRYGHEGYPVVDGDQHLVGLITRRQVDRALQHQMGDTPVGLVMEAGQVLVRPSDPVTRLQHVMADSQWGQVPVCDRNGRMIGIVTRTDVLRANLPERSQRTANVADRLRTALSDAVWYMIAAVGRTAATLDVPLYFVGGLVRDLLGGREARDIDFVIEGSALDVVEALVAEYGGRRHAHTHFGTAKWLLDDGVWAAMGAPAAETHNGRPDAIDFVTARTEYYQQPTVLPTVTRGSIKLDLLRRDFTINALAIRLDGHHLGELLDYANGLADLESGVIRVLHSLSFVEDPTRIFRAIRYEQRLDFTIEPRTLRLLKHARPLISRLTAARVRSEIELALLEPDPHNHMRRLDELNILHQLAEGCRWDPASTTAIRALSSSLEQPTWRRYVDDLLLLRFLLWVGPLPSPVQAALLARLRVRKQTMRDVQALEELQRILTALDPEQPPSYNERMLRLFADTPHALLAARVLHAGTPQATLIDQFEATWRHVRATLNGNDLMAAGVAPGPRIAELLAQLRGAYLDGVVSNAAEERAYLADLLAQQRA